MANQSKKPEKTKKTNNKNLIICCCAAIVIIIVAIVVIVMVNNSGISDGYFVSDDTKYVLTIENDNVDDEDADQYTPLKTHLVYTYEGDTVTGLKSYYQYADATSAKAAYDAIKETITEEGDQIELNGKYVIVAAREDVYKDTTASDVKQQIEFMETLKNMNTSDGTDADDVDDTTDDTDTDKEDQE